MRSKATGPGGGGQDGMLKHAWCIKMRPMGVDRGEGGRGEGEVRKWFGFCGIGERGVEKARL